MPVASHTLTSVWEGSDADLLDRLLDLYPRRLPRLILDATVNVGRFWRGTPRRVVGLDVDRRHRPDVLGDNLRLPFAAGTFDVVVYDPPHIPNYSPGRECTKDFDVRFGLGGKAGAAHGHDLAHTFRPFVAEAVRVLVPEGLLLAKITDYIHNHRYHWAHLDLVAAGRLVGLTACDCVVKVRRGPIMDPRWKVAHHVRRRHCYWLVFRKSDRCE